MGLGVVLVMALTLMMIWKGLEIRVTLDMELVLGWEHLQVEQNSLLTMMLTTIFILWVLGEKWTGIDQETTAAVVHLQLLDHRCLSHVLSHLTFYPLLLCGLVEYSLIGCDEYNLCSVNIDVIVGMTLEKKCLSVYI
jgi:hypothetical protein